MRIEAVRRLLPRCWFNEETTEAGRDALGYYHENATRLGTSGWDRLMIGQAMRATLSAGCALPMRSSHDRYSKLQSQDRNAEGRNCVERDYFVIKDLDVYCEVEGGFQDYILSGGHTSELMWLEDALRRIGDIVSGDIFTELRSMNESQRSEMKPLCDRYFDRRPSTMAVAEAAP